MKALTFRTRFKQESLRGWEGRLAPALVIGIQRAGGNRPS
jgi:hypothetical protein